LDLATGTGIVAVIAARAYGLGLQLARDPAHAAIVPHVLEVKRLKGFTRRKKAAQTPQTPAPTPAPVPVTSTTPKA